MSTDAAVASGHTCSDCHAILQWLIRPPLSTIDEDDKDTRINVNELAHIESNENNCSLYRLISRIFAQNRPEGWARQSGDRIYCCINGGRPRISANGIRRDWAIELEFFYLDQEEERQVEYLWRPFFQLLIEDVALLHVNEECSQLGRLQYHVPLDSSYHKTCLQKCFRKHSNLCEPGGKIFAPGSAPLPPGMRLIDVMEEKVVTAPPKPGYVALSYVWGATNFLTLTKDTINALSMPRVLSTMKVPKTIDDAISATRAYSHRYLWVDALCILQDDESEKISQIQNMDIIYSKALFTIVALDSSHADGGLWRRDTESGKRSQVVEEIGGLRFIGSPPLIDVPLQASTWYSRAWTFQEFTLSRRLLFFSDYQDYYSCDTSACASTYIDSFGGPGRIKLDYDEKEHLSPLVGRASNYQKHWPQLLQGYCKRALSFESDGLNAAAGVLRKFANDTSDGFLCGLPVSTLFESSMLWFAAGSLRRRGPTSTGAPFPSWSWVGWVGPVSYEHFEESSAIVECRVIRQWSAEHTGGVLPSKSLHFPKSAGRLQSEMSEEESSRRNALLPTIQSCILCFETRTASFYVDATYWNQFYETNDQDCEHTGLYKILDEAAWIGSIHMEHETAKTFSPDAKHEFIVLSQSTNQVYPRQIDVRPRDLDADVVLPYDERLLDEHDWQVHNVMLISWKDDVAYRQGIGQIHKASFEAAAWTNKQIRLG